MGDEQTKPVSVQTSQVDESASFNESELEDIMSEIESLESEFGESPVEEAITEVEDEVSLASEEISSGKKSEPEASAEDELSDALGIGANSEPVAALEITHEDISKTSLQKAIDNEVDSLLESHKVEEAPVRSNVVQLSEPVTPVAVTEHHTNKREKETAMKGDNQVTLKVAGEMSLDLMFDISGEKVHLYVKESEGLCIELGSGAKFVVPIKSMPLQKVG